MTEAMVKANTSAGSIETTDPDLEVVDLCKSFAGSRVLDDVSFAVHPAEFVSLLGPSGCGKSTTLNIVSGFMQPEGGIVRIGGADVTAKPAHKRDSSVVFQNYALFPHLTVEENVTYGLKAKKLPKDEIEALLKWGLSITAIENLRERYPTQLSGGQQQRVAVARSLVMRPRILLMDEPLSNLDAKLRAELRQELKVLQRDTAQSVLFVTHDQTEALSLSDRVVVMNVGKIEQVGSPREVYESPESTFVAKFMGVENVFGLTNSGVDYGTAGGLTFSREWLPRDVRAVGIRPSRVRVSRTDTSGEGTWTTSGTVSAVTYLGDTLRYDVIVGGETIVCVNDASLQGAEVGEEVRLSVDHADLLPLSR